VVAFIAKGFCHAFDSKVIALRGPRGEDNLTGRSSDGRSDLAAALLNRCSGGPSEGMAIAGGVAKIAGEKREHFFQHTWIHGSSGVVIQIDRKLHRGGGMSVAAHLALILLKGGAWIQEEIKKPASELAG
jgi:hypothetical protein